jgi:hypothetical protein
VWRPVPRDLAAVLSCRYPRTVARPGSPATSRAGRTRPAAPSSRSAVHELGCGPQASRPSSSRRHECRARRRRPGAAPPPEPEHAAASSAGPLSERTSSGPFVQSRTKARSYHSRSIITLAMPSASAPSLPGRTRSQTSALPASPTRREVAVVGEGAQAPPQNVHPRGAGIHHTPDGEVARLEVTDARHSYRTRTE